jgi:putative endonuclease
MTRFFFVYVLESERDSNWYIGFTTDVERRVREHNDGTSRSTKHRRPLKLIYFEAYLEENDAKGRERFLKSGSCHRFLKRQMRNYLKNSSGRAFTKKRLIRR